MVSYTGFNSSGAFSSTKGVTTGIVVLLLSQQCTARTSGIRSFELNRFPAPHLPARRDDVFKPWFWRQEPIFNRRRGAVAQASPLFNWHKNSSFHPPACHDLRAFFESSVQKLTEAGSCIL